MKKIILFIHIIFFYNSSLLACNILSINIGDTVNQAKPIFDFLSTYDHKIWGQQKSAKYTVPASFYCESSNLEASDLEVIVYDNKIAGMHLVNYDTETPNEVYQFTKDFISDPGEDASEKNWTGSVKLDIGSLLIRYRKAKLGKDIIEYLYISNLELIDYTMGEDIVEANF